ncbi:hypothetical protein [Sinorhizobium meliloti]|uniref:hypothetical protein n=1 Tax=Rhizobium meliloti TaxID=382 RepID=UPI000FDA69BE|nr:hypothetical protein [Sinorhizobium meliloti]RVG20632.1 hypothetical protein CN231_04370 [Sinorhizobium meliloti]
MVTFVRVPGSAAYVEGGNARAARVVVISHEIDPPAQLSLGNGPHPVSLNTCSFAISGAVPSAASDAEIEADLAKLGQDVLQAAGSRRLFCVRAFGKPYNQLGELAFKETKSDGATRFELIANGEIVTPQIEADGELTEDFYRLRFLAPSSSKLIPFATVVGDRLVISRTLSDPLVVRFIVSTLQPNDKRTSVSADVAIPLTAPNAGVVLFDISTQSIPDDEDALANLRATLVAGFVSGQSGGLREHREFAVLRAAAGKSLRLRSQLDPLAVTDRERSFLAIEAPDGVVETTFTTTHGQSLLLRPLSADPSARSPRFYFYPQWTGAKGFTPRTSLLIDGDFEVVVPPVPAEDKRRSFGIVCGLSEREYVPLRPGDRLAFRAGYDGFYGYRSNGATATASAGKPRRDAKTRLHPDQPSAKALQSVLPRADTVEPAVAEPSKPNVLTSWMAVIRASSAEPGAPFAGATAVVSESRDFTLFRRDPDAVAAFEAAHVGTVLDHAPIEVIPRSDEIEREFLLPLRASHDDPAMGHAIPVFPWQGYRTDGVSNDATLSLLVDLERDYLHSRRRKLLRPKGDVRLAQIGGAKAIVEAKPTRRYTPMGLEVEEVNGRINTVYLARSTNQDGNDVEVEVSLTNISEELSDALQRSDLFLVVDRWPSGSFTSGDREKPMRLRVSMRGWTVEIDLPQGGAQPQPSDPLIILKGVRGALKNLIHLPGAYALPETFLSGGETGIPDLAKKIEGLQQRNLDAAKAKELKDPKYNKYFNKIEGIFDDPLWTGVLIYGVALDPSALPDQITGLLAGAGDLKKLDVHHLGIDVRRIDFEPLEADAKRRASPMFGLVSYIDFNNPEIEGSTDGPRSFAVTLNKLLVQFENGEVRHFEAEARLKIRHMFDGIICGTVNGTPFGRDPVIKILGSYERRIDNGRPIDVYSFTNTQKWVLDFNKDDKCSQDLTKDLGLLKSVELNKVVFATKSVEDIERNGAKGKDIEARFALDGKLKFNKWPDQFTLFEGDEEISFRDLGIRLGFQLFGKVADKIKLDFWPGGFSLDFSEIRSLKGLLGKLPISFDRFEWWPNGIDFPKLGFFRLDGGRAPKADDPVKFGISFDLDLGSLGKLSEVLGKFRMKILVGFGYDLNNITAPKFALGFKFENNGGAGLDIGIGNILRIQADAYDYRDLNDVYFIYALNARIKVFGQTVPPDKSSLNLFLFLDPGGKIQGLTVSEPVALPGRKGSKRDNRRKSPVRGAHHSSPSILSGEVLPPEGKSAGNAAAGGGLTLGWFAVLTSAEKEEPKSFAIPLLALGQRVDPFQVQAPNNVRGVVDAVATSLGNISTYKDDLEKRPPDIKGVTDFLVQKIHFAPDRDWVAALRVEIAKIMGLDLVLRDPDLYGAYFRFGPKNDPIFEVDIMYRKLSADLGVYAVDIIPPSVIRRIQLGAATITLPIIHLDIYTDGGFNVDIGFPHNRNFERSFGVEIVPYTGAGGFYFGRLSGLGAKLTPQKLLEGDPKYEGIFRYDPVTQLGFGARVGLGKRIDIAPFRAELSVTIYVFLQGAQGRLRVMEPDRLKDVPEHLLPASTYAVVSGAIGILGELKGSVDFPLIRCEVLIVIYVEIGAVVRTDDYVVLYIEAGVRVAVSVVIARIRIFRKTFEIRVSFSFSAKIRHETKSGSRREGFETIYQFQTGSRALEAKVVVPRREWPLAVSKTKQLQSEIEAWTNQRIDWQLVPTLRDLGLADKIPIAPWFVPDITVGEELDATGAVVARLHTVFNLYLADDKQDDPQAARTPAEQWVWATAAWLLYAGLLDHPAARTGDFLTWSIDIDTLGELRKRLALGMERPGVEGLPRYDDIRGFFKGPVALTIKAPPPSAKERRAAFFPLPVELALVRRFKNGAGHADAVVELPDQGLLTPELEKEIEGHFDGLKAILEDRSASGTRALASMGEPLAKEIFEEHAGHLMRALVAKLEEIVTRAGSPSFTVGQALDKLVEPAEDAAPSPARSIAAMTGRFFQYGLAFPQPVNHWTTVKMNVPEDLRDLIDSKKRDTLPLYRYASLQIPVARPVKDGKPESPTHVGIKQVGATPWFTLTGEAGQNGEIFYELEDGGEHSIEEVAKAANDLPAVAAALPFTAEIKLERRDTRRGSAATFRRQIRQGPDQWLFGLPSDLAGTETELSAVALELRNVGTEGHVVAEGSAEAFNAQQFQAALVVEVGIKGIRVPGQSGFLDGVYELTGAREYERRLLDRLLDPPPSQDLVAAQAEARGPEVDVESVQLFLIEPSSEGCALLDAGTHMVQTNLSVDRRPAAALTALARDSVESFSAPMESIMFAEFIRRGAIVNSGGFWLISKDPTLKQRVLDAEHPKTIPNAEDRPVEGPAKDVRVLLVLTYRKELANLSVANALRVGYTGAGQQQAERLATFARDFDAGDRTPVILAGGELARDPVPGTLPLEVTVPHTARLYPSLERAAATGATFEEFLPQFRLLKGQSLEAATPIAELAARFNLLEYVIADGGDHMFRQTQRADVLPVGEAEPTDSLQVSEEVAENLTFKLTLPLHRLTMIGATDPASNPYRIVGKRVAVRFNLRDIYGNTLPIEPKFAASGEFSSVYTIPYLDAPIAPGDLPHIDIVWDPAKNRRIQILLTFSPEGLWAGLGDDHKGKDGETEEAINRLLPAEFLEKGPTAAPKQQFEKWESWAKQIADRCEAAAERYKLADYQLENASAVCLHTTLAPATQRSTDPYEPAGMGEIPADKVGLRTFYAAVVAKLSLMAAEIRAHLNEPDSVPWVLITSAPIIGDFKVRVPIPQTALFIEARLALVISRNGPAREDRFLRAMTEVPPSFVRQFPFTQKEPPVIKFADSVVQILLPGYRAALGAPAAAGRSGESLWFVAEAMMPEAASPGDGEYPGYYALPPMRNAPASFTFKDKLVWPQQGTAYQKRPAVNLLDVDADAYAKDALQMIEDLLDPRAIKLLMTTTSGRNVLDQAVLAKESLALPIARMARHVLSNAPTPTAPPELVANLADRFKRTLSAVYAIDTVLTYEFSWQKEPPARPGEDPEKRTRPILYGKLSFARPGEPPEGMSLDVGSLELPSDPGSRTSKFHILYDSTSGKAVDQGHFHPYEITHVQRMPQPDLDALGKEKIERRYRETQWLKLIKPLRIPLSKDDQEQTEIPIVLRQLPVRPQITNHSFLPGFELSPPGSRKELKDLQQARSWIFDLAWTWNAAAQDELEIGVEYAQLHGSRALRSSGADLATLLTGFVVALEDVWPKVLDDLATGTPLLDALLMFIADELGRLQRAAITARNQSALSLPVDRIVVDDRQGGIWKAKWKTATETGAELKAHPSHTIPTSGSNAPKIDGQNGKLRIVGIDVLRFAQAQAELDLYRNRTFSMLGKPDGVPAADPFVYHLGGIRGAEPITPRLSHDVPFEGKRTQPLKAHVDEILNALFPAELGTTYQLYDLDLSEVTGVVSVGRPETNGTAVLPKAFVVPGTTMPRISGLVRGSGDDATIVSAIRTWRDDQGLTLPGSGSPPDRYLRFAFRVYRDAEGPGGTSPVLQIHRIEIPLRQIDSMS